MYFCRSLCHFLCCFHVDLFICQSGFGFKILCFLQPRRLCFTYMLIWTQSLLSLNRNKYFLKLSQLESSSFHKCSPFVIDWFLNGFSSCQTSCTTELLEIYCNGGRQCMPITNHIRNHVLRTVLVWSWLMNACVQGNKIAYLMHRCCDRFGTARTVERFDSFSSFCISFQ